MKRKSLPCFLRFILVLTGIIVSTVFNIQAQKFAYVNTEYILENIPDYKNSQQHLDNLAITWQKEIEDK